MKTIAQLLYHALLAWIYNYKAGQLARQMRSGETAEVRAQASKQLITIGTTSNIHERERGRCWDKIRRRPIRYVPQLIVVVGMAGWLLSLAAR